MNLEEFAESIYLNLPYDPNDQQIELIAALAAFCSDATPSDSVFLLNGYAGTGKTSLTGALVRSLAELRIPVVLMAPTGAPPRFSLVTRASPPPPSTAASTAPATAAR